MFAVIAIVAFGTIDALHWEYHRLSLMFSTTVFSIYASIPLIFHVIRAQMMEDAALAQQNEDLARELEISQNEAQRDFLTGAYNRHQLGGGFARFSALAYERGFKFSFAIFDVDHFKIVNDTKGHLAGDQILKQIADTIHEKIDRRHLFIRDDTRQLFERSTKLRMPIQDLSAHDVSAAIGREKVPVISEHDSIRCGKLSVRGKDDHHVDLPVCKCLIFQSDIEIRRAPEC